MQDADRATSGLGNSEVFANLLYEVITDLGMSGHGRPLVLLRVVPPRMPGAFT